MAWNVCFVFAAVCWLKIFKSIISISIGLDSCILTVWSFLKITIFFCFCQILTLNKPTHMTTTMRNQINKIHLFSARTGERKIDRWIERLYGMNRHEMSSEIHTAIQQKKARNCAEFRIFLERVSLRILNLDFALRAPFQHRQQSRKMKKNFVDKREEFVSF